MLWWKEVWLEVSKAMHLGLPILVAMAEHLFVLRHLRYHCPKRRYPQLGLDDELIAFSGPELRLHRGGCGGLSQQTWR